jgi:hypothetical protein
MKELSVTKNFWIQNLVMNIEEPDSPIYLNKTRLNILDALFNTYIFYILYLIVNCTDIPLITPRGHGEKCAISLNTKIKYVI